MQQRYELVESRMRGDTHVRFGGRVGETDQPPGWNCAPARPYWYWDGYGWRPTAYNPWAPTPAAPALVYVTADGLWWWDGYGWRPTVAAHAYWESERRRRIQSWLNLGAAALLFLR